MEILTRIAALAEGCNCCGPRELGQTKRTAVP